MRKKVVRSQQRLFVSSLGFPEYETSSDPIGNILKTHNVVVCIGREQRFWRTACSLFQSGHRRSIWILFVFKYFELVHQKGRNIYWKRRFIPLSSWHGTLKKTPKWVPGRLNTIRSQLVTNLIHEILRDSHSMLVFTRSRLHLINAQINSD